MVSVDYDPKFLRVVGKIKDTLLKEKIRKIISKIIENPEIGKPMRYGRKGTREVYLKPFRVSYIYLKKEDKIVLFEVYHKKKQ